MEAIQDLGGRRALSRSNRVLAPRRQRAVWAVFVTISSRIARASLSPEPSQRSPETLGPFKGALVGTSWRHARPTSVKALALSLPAQAFHAISWREGTNAPLSGQFAALRVRHDGGKLTRRGCAPWSGCSSSGRRMRSKGRAIPSFELW